ncbi:MAG: galactokinase [Bacteroidota bacterium]
MKDQVISSFIKNFQDTPLVVFAPGRINLIGEHTDYQEGFVFPAAITQGIWVGIKKNNLGSLCRLYSLDFDQEFSFDLHHLSPKKGHWATYIMGICAQLKQSGYPVEGFDLALGGNTPIGAGLSSSAAISIATALAISEAFHFQVPKKNLVVYAQKSEHLFAGVNCGIMDPYACAFGKAQHALLLDCRSQTHQEIPVEFPGYALLLTHSKVSHSLADSAYNARRAACEESMFLLKDLFPSAHTLRDLSCKQLEVIQEVLPKTLYPKAKHVISECTRVHEAADALRAGNVKGFGDMLYASHQSLSKDFEVSCAELDYLVEQARVHGSVLGSRMMGGGFGGCTLSLVRQEALEDICAHLEKMYSKKFQLVPDFIRVEIGSGASQV